MLPSCCKHRVLPLVQLFGFGLRPPPAHHRSVPPSSWSKSSNPPRPHRKRPPCTPPTSALAMQKVPNGSIMSGFCRMGNARGAVLHCAVAVPASNEQARNRNRDNLSFIVSVLSVELFSMILKRGQVRLRFGSPSREARYP